MPSFAAQLGNAVFAAQAVQHDPDLVLGRKVSARRSTDVLHHFAQQKPRLAIWRLRIWVSSSFLRRGQNPP
jgi:hypothetical protein